MKKMTKFAAVALAALMAVSVTACGKSGGTKTDKGDGTYTVGICQLVEHPALDAATKGFKEALQEKLGDKVKFEEKNAQNDTETCSTIVNGFVSSDVDLILANATPALQAAVVQFLFSEHQLQNMVLLLISKISQVRQVLTFQEHLTLLL